MALQPLRIPFYQGSDTPDLLRNFLEVERFFKGLQVDPVTGAFVFNYGSSSSVTFMNAGIELYQAGSTPFIDFHHAASPAGDSNADFNVRFINSVSNFLTIQPASSAQGGLLVGLSSAGGPAAFVGNDASYGNVYAQFSHALNLAAGRYALLQGGFGSGDQNTYLNCVSGAQINFRLNNNTQMYMDTNGSFHGIVAGASGSFGEVWPGGTWTGGGTPKDFLIQAGTVVLNFGGGNQNITYPTAFPNGVLCCVVVNGDSGGSAGGAATVLSVSNPSLSGCGISDVASTTGAGINGNVRVNFIAVGY